MAENVNNAKKERKKNEKTFGFDQNNKKNPQVVIGVKYFITNEFVYIASATFDDHRAAFRSFKSGMGYLEQISFALFIEKTSKIVIKIYFSEVSKSKSINIVTR